MRCDARFLIINYDILQNKRLTIASKLVYAFILSFYRANPKEYFNKSNTFIAQELGLTKMSVIRSLEQLENLGLIKCKYAKSLGVYSNRLIELPDKVIKQDVDLIKLFESVYKKIK